MVGRQGRLDSGARIGPTGQGPEGSWGCDAYLHRKEGDQGNATYWYGRAVKACLPRTTRRGVAQLRERFARISAFLLRLGMSQA